MSKGTIKIIKALELTIRVPGRIQKNIVNAYLKCDGLPILWKKQYLKMAHDEGYKYNQHCRMRESLVVMDVSDYVILLLQKRL